MKTSETKTTKHTFFFEEVKEMVGEYMAKRNMISKLPEFTTIRAKKGTASVEPTVLEVSYTELLKETVE